MGVRKYTDEQIAQVLSERDAGMKWSVLGLVYGGLAQAAMYHLRTLKLPPRSHGVACSNCDHMNHIRTHFCRGCGYITEAGKTAK